MTVETTGHVGTAAPAAEQAQEAQLPPPAACSGGSNAAAAPPPPSSQLCCDSLAEEVKASQVALRQLFDAWDAGRPVQEADLQPLRGQPGVRLEPISWAELTALLADGSERALATLGRTPQQLKEYWDYRDREILGKYASVTDYLQCRIFGFEAQQQQGAGGKLKAVVPPGFFGSSNNGSDSSGNRRDERSMREDGSSNGDSGSGFTLVTMWRDNDFPYFLEPGIVHMNLWANRPLAAEEVEARIAQKVPAGLERAWFVNTPALQSVPTIWHAHVLWQKV